MVVLFGKVWEFESEICIFRDLGIVGLFQRNQMDGWMNGGMDGWDGMGWDGMGWDGMGWDGMGWDMDGDPLSRCRNVSGGSTMTQRFTGTSNALTSLTSGVSHRKDT